MLLSEPLATSNEPVFLASSEAMAILRLKRSAFYAYVAQGAIPAVKIGHFLRFRRNDIINFGKKSA
jgi:predicted DNA-binding transcriptional regulator AlpA